MNIINTTPWGLLGDMDRQMRHFVGTVRNKRALPEKWTPNVDIHEESERFVLVADIPGVDLEAIDISINDGILKISGSRNTGAENESTEIKRRERISGDFERSFHLPDTVDVDAVNASGSNGVLQVVIPKKSVSKPRKIQITH